MRSGQPRAASKWTCRSQGGDEARAGPWELGPRRAVWKLCQSQCRGSRCPWGCWMGEESGALAGQLSGRALPGSRVALALALPPGGTLAMGTLWALGQPPPLPRHSCWGTGCTLAQRVDG